MPGITLTTNEQEELDILQTIITQLNRPEGAEILQDLLALQEGSNADTIGLLRKKIFILYDNEVSTPANAVFYEALFNLLLLLAKYHPLNEIAPENGLLECPITRMPIDASNSVLTSQGYLYDRVELLNSFGFHVENALHAGVVPILRNPMSNHPFSERELSYLNEVKPAKGTILGKICNYCDKHMNGILLGGCIGLMLYVIAACVHLEQGGKFEDTNGKLVLAFGFFGTTIGGLLGAYLQEKIDFYRTPEQIKRLLLSIKTSAVQIENAVSLAVTEEKTVSVVHSFLSMFSHPRATMRQALMANQPQNNDFLARV